MKTTINREKIKKNLTAPTKESERLKIFRKAENLNQTEIGEILGCHQTQVFKYENGENIIPVSVVKTLNKKLKLSYEWFFNGAGNMKVAEKEQKTINVVTDTANNVKMLEELVKKLSADINKIGRDFYDFKNTYNKQL